MKLNHLIAIAGIVWIFWSCGSGNNGLSVLNSQSFHDTQITFNSRLMQRLSADTVASVQDKNPLMQPIEDMISRAEKLKANPSDSGWTALSASWEDFMAKYAGSDGILFMQDEDSSANSQNTIVLEKWAELNKSLLKFSGEVRFGDALERLLYEPKVPVQSEKFLKSVIYTHLDDQIFVNLIGSSSLNHYHTTGGTIKLIQVTDFPESNEMTLKCECDDTRFLDVFIRIPSWAVNPTVSHGNVKYVARAGEYCEISRKWKDGDEFKIVLKN